MVGIAFSDGNFDARITRHIERLAIAIGLPFALALQLDATGTTDTFHDFRCASVEGQARRKDDTPRLLRAISKYHRVADAFAIKINIGLFDHGNIVVLRHLNTPEFLND